MGSRRIEPKLVTIGDEEIVEFENHEFLQLKYQDILYKRNAVYTFFISFTAS